jgi:bacteriocin-like protein
VPDKNFESHPLIVLTEKEMQTIIGGCTAMVHDSSSSWDIIPMSLCEA